MSRPSFAPYRELEAPVPPEGRDPNTYANCLWAFGLHDRAFGEREVFGKVRPMTSDSTRRKKDTEAYRERVRRREETAAPDRTCPPADRRQPYDGLTGAPRQLAPPLSPRRDLPDAT